jgi:phage/plasmid-like protein (TIGR03299 family)
MRSTLSRRSSTRETHNRLTAFNNRESTPIPFSSPTLASDLGLDWPVAVQPAYVMDADANPRPIPHRLAVVRGDTGAPLGVVGERYEPVQNETLLNLVRSVSDPESKVVGSQVVDGGASFHLTASVPGLARAIKGDALDGRITISNSHDGSGALRLSMMIFRLVCTNGMRAWRADGSHTMRHTLSIHSKVDAVALAYRETIAQFAGMVDRLTVLADIPNNPKHLERITLAAFGVTLEDIADETERSRTIRQNRMDAIATLRRSPTNNHAGTGSTLYSDLQAVTEWINHGRGDETGLGILDGSGADMIERATVEAFAIAGV